MFIMYFSLYAFLNWVHLFSAEHVTFTSTELVPVGYSSFGLLMKLCLIVDLYSEFQLILKQVAMATMVYSAVGNNFLRLRSIML